MNALIIDIDGTISDNRHRRSYAVQPHLDWDKYNDLAVQDPPRREVLCVVLALLKEYPALTPVFVTGRPEKYRAQTDGWLKRHVDCVRFELFMREEPEYRTYSEAAVKSALYDRHFIGTGWHARLAIDDAHADVWRNKGVECWHVTRETMRVSPLRAYRR